MRERKVPGENAERDGAPIKVEVEKADIDCYGLWAAIGLAAQRENVTLDLIPQPQLEDGNK
ncbi:MAG TPA: hypothetical protein VMW04_01180 [Patescibacteria group bacterium]|nr:hypothetical protein [Patescibacteria group bacterium]